mgnify:CR=1 FL=1
MKFDNFRTLLTKNINDAKIILGSASYDLGCSCGSGTRDAPKKLKELSGYLPLYDTNFHNLEDVSIYDYCDIDQDELINNQNFYDVLYEKAKEILDHNKFMLFFGGDHSISIPLEKAFFEKYQKEGKKPVIIHIDAHMDILDTYMDSNMSHACPNRRAIDNGYLPSDIHMVGIRSFEKEEVEFKEQNPSLDVITSDMFRRMGPTEVAKRIINAHGDDAAYYISFDIDAIDPSFAPGTGTPESFGLTPLELRGFFSEIFANVNVFAMDLVEISPSLDVNDITSWLGLKMLYEIFYFKFIRG